MNVLSDRSKLKRRQVFVLGAILVGTASSTMPFLLAGVLALRLREDLGLSDFQLSLALGAFFASTGICSLLGGRIADHEGWSRTLALGLVLNVAVQLGIAVVVQSFGHLMASMIFAGAAHSLTGPAGNLSVVREVGVGHQGLAFGVRQAAVPLAAMLAGLSLGAIAVPFGWRWNFIAAACLPLGALLLWPFWRETDGLPGGSRALSGPLAYSTGLSLVVIGVAFATAGVGVLGIFAVIALVSAGLSEATAGLIIAMASALGLLIRIGGGWLADRRELSGLTLVAALLLLGSVGYGLLALDGIAVAVVGVIIAFAAGWGWPGLFHFGLVAFHPEAPGAVTGIAQLGLAAGGLVGPYAFVAVSASSGTSRSWMFVAGLAIVAATLIWSGGIVLTRRNRHM